MERVMMRDEVYNLGTEDTCRRAPTVLFHHTESAHHVRHPLGRAIGGNLKEAVQHNHDEQAVHLSSIQRPCPLGTDVAVVGKGTL